MPSIDQFIEHRWQDAKEELRKHAPEFVKQNENTVRLQRVGLSPPWPIDPASRPTTRLSKIWHRLLEGCYELARQAMVLETAAECLTGESFRNLPLQVAGARAAYSLRSWFIHATTLCDQTMSVIRLTLDVYITDNPTKKAIREKCKSLIHKNVRSFVIKQRNSYVHAENESWAQGITKDGLWEGAVSIGLTPRREFEEFGLCRNGKRALNGTYNIFRDYTEETLKRLAQILGKFENELANNRQV